MSEKYPVKALWRSLILNDEKTISEYEENLVQLYNKAYDNKNYYVDLLLFNYKLNRFIVCELKLNSVNARDIGQTLNYIKIIDKTLKEKNHKNTIGIIVSKRNDKFILEYVSDLSLMLTTYKLENNFKKATA